MSVTTIDCFQYKILLSLYWILLLTQVIPSTAGSPPLTDTSNDIQICAKLQSMLSYGKYQTTQMPSNISYVARYFGHNFIAYSTIDNLLIFIEPKSQLHVYDAQTIQHVVDVNMTDVVIATSCVSLVSNSHHELFFIYETNSITNLISLRVCQVHFNRSILEFEANFCIETIHIQHNRPDLRINGFTIKRDHAGTQHSLLFMSTEIGIVYIIFHTNTGLLIGNPKIMNSTLTDGSIAMSSSGSLFYASRQEHLIYELILTNDFRLNYGKVIKTNAIKYPFGVITDECNHLYIATRSMILVMHIPTFSTIRSIFSKTSDVPITLERLNATTYVYATIKLNPKPLPSYWTFNFLYFTNAEKHLFTRFPVFDRHRFLNLNQAVIDDDHHLQLNPIFDSLSTATHLTSNSTYMINIMGSVLSESEVLTRNSSVTFSHPSLSDTISLTKHDAIRKLMNRTGFQTSTELNQSTEESLIFTAIRSKRNITSLSALTSSKAYFRTKNRSIFDTDNVSRSIRQDEYISSTNRSASVENIKSKFLTNNDVIQRQSYSTSSNSFIDSKEPSIIDKNSGSSTKTSRNVSETHQTLLNQNLLLRNTTNTAMSFTIPTNRENTQSQHHLARTSLSTSGQVLNNDFRKTRSYNVESQSNLMTTLPTYVSKQNTISLFRFFEKHITEHYSRTMQNEHHPSREQPSMIDLLHSIDNDNESLTEFNSSSQVESRTNISSINNSQIRTQVLKQLFSNNNSLGEFLTSSKLPSNIHSSTEHTYSNHQSQITPDATKLSFYDLKSIDSFINTKRISLNTSERDKKTSNLSVEMGDNISKQTQSNQNTFPNNFTFHSSTYHHFPNKRQKTKISNTTVSYSYVNDNTLHNSSNSINSSFLFDNTSRFKTIVYRQLIVPLWNQSHSYVSHVHNISSTLPTEISSTKKDRSLKNDFHQLPTNESNSHEFSDFSQLTNFYNNGYQKLNRFLSTPLSRSFTHTEGIFSSSKPSKFPKMSYSNAHTRPTLSDTSTTNLVTPQSDKSKSRLKIYNLTVPNIFESFNTPQSPIKLSESSRQYNFINDNLNDKSSVNVNKSFDMKQILTLSELTKKDTIASTSIHSDKNNKTDHKYVTIIPVGVNISSMFYLLSPFTNFHATLLSSHRSSLPSPPPFLPVAKPSSMSPLKVFSDVKMTTMATLLSSARISTDPASTMKSILPSSSSQSPSTTTYFDRSSFPSTVLSTLLSTIDEQSQLITTDPHSHTTTSSTKTDSESFSFAQSTAVATKHTSSTTVKSSLIVASDELSTVASTMATTDEESLVTSTPETIITGEMHYPSSSVSDEKYQDKFTTFMPSSTSYATNTSKITTTSKTSRKRPITSRVSQTRLSTQPYSPSIGVTSVPSIYQTTDTPDNDLLTSTQVLTETSEWIHFGKQDTLIIKPMFKENESNPSRSNDLLNQILNNASTSTNSSIEKTILFDFNDLPATTWNLSLNSNESFNLNLVLPTSSSSINPNTTKNLTFANIQANNLSTNIVGVPVNLQLDQIQAKKFSLNMNITNNDPNSNTTNSVVPDVFIGRVTSEQFQLNLSKTTNMNLRVQQVDSATAELNLDSNFCTNDTNLEINLNLSQKGTIRYGNRKAIHIGPVYARVHMLKEACDREQPLTLFFDICKRQNPCMNGGTCRSVMPNYQELVHTQGDTGHVGYKCQCPPHVSGEHCQHLQYPLGYCLNGGSLFQIYDRYNRSIERCMCPTGFRGEHCEENIDNCVFVTCSDRGICEDGIDSYKCVCFDGFYGFYCERTYTQTVLLQAASRSFAVVAILLIAAIIGLVVASDIHTFLTKKKTYRLLNEASRVKSELYENSVLLLGFRDAPIEIEDSTAGQRLKKPIALKPRLKERTIRDRSLEDYEPLANRKPLINTSETISKHHLISNKYNQATII